MRENEYYASRSEMMTRLINTLGFGIASLSWASGPYSGQSYNLTAYTRGRGDSATLRALGFNTTSVVVSVLTEAMMLGVIGGVIGGGAAYLAFNGFETSTMNFQTFQSGCLRIPGHSQAVAFGACLCALHRSDRRPPACDSSSATPDYLGTARVVSARANV